MHHKNHYSVQEAKDIIEKINPDLYRLIELISGFKLVGKNIFRHPILSGKPMNGEQFDEKEVEFVNILKEVMEKGVVVKNIETGLIDIPHMRNNGEEVYLCYKYGENELEYWHNIKDGFSGRKNITEL